MDQPTISSEPQSSAPAPSPHAQKNKLKLIWGLICLIGPAALIIVAFMLYAIVNFVLVGSGPGDSTELFGSRSVGATTANIILFCIGALSTLAFLPGVVVGIILLATRK